MARVFVITLGLLLIFPSVASAHKFWLLPSQTVFSGTESLVTVDAAISNDLFYFNHHPLSVETLEITAPDGSRGEATNVATGRYRSVFDVALPQNGTYRITVPRSGLFASWEVDGERARWRGTAEEFAGKVPANATNLQVSESVSRVETFVSNGNLTQESLRPSNEGIELVPITHPNDLYAGEKANFQFLVDGKPAAGLEVEIVKGGTRYRDAQEEVHVTTDANGEIAVQWDEPGMYWLEVATTDDKVKVEQAKQRSLRYTATFEVLPQ